MHHLEPLPHQSCLCRPRSDDFADSLSNFLAFNRAGSALGHRSNSPARMAAGSVGQGVRAPADRFTDWGGDLLQLTMHVAHVQ